MADGAKYGLWRAMLAGFKLVNFIHDEYIVELPLDDTLQERRRALEALMVESMQAFIPDVRVAVESTLMPRWYKEAEALWTEKAKTAMEIWTPERAAEIAAAKKASEAARAAEEAAEAVREQELREAMEDFHVLIEDELPALADTPQ